MKKTSTNSSLFHRSGTTAFRVSAFLSAAILLSACAFTDYGNRINTEQLEIAKLEERRHSLETQYIIVLNNLEVHPGEEKLVKEQDQVRRKLIDVTSLIHEKRKLLDASIREWEQKIIQEKIEREMIDREIRENEGKDEDVEFLNK